MEDSVNEEEESSEGPLPAISHPPPPRRGDPGGGGTMIFLLLRARPWALESLSWLELAAGCPHRVAERESSGVESTCNLRDSAPGTCSPSTCPRW